jgi:putative SOS response-associated peptidase YedK
MKEALGLARKPRGILIKDADRNNRIYPGYFANVMVSEKGKRVFKPMRYRVRPSGSGMEIPSKYNVFNARLDALEKRQTWKNIFMKNHGIFPFIRFYEWVKNEQGKKVLITFNPENRNIMWAPVIFDTWISNDKKVTFDSFALLTNDPPPEIAEQGHDRCPIFLREDLINTWMRPEESSKTDIYKLLNSVEQVNYGHFLAA